ncbi:hypothetical protein SDRG_14133 [Saprolegnia diclina VS20]|uniref:Pentacotripeptide-repeat region of PRORP domain-containing protein n=1 Tax=Saprolegnia diclina (strain VS20) TaxID=1156394 RepID=T0REL3_SAPDV|nr:hypothetical protein SDRG_14133 [Saprolegnia diclina VS20]EQC28037.1 hypothetical protein SDRG_14133 [Saprolegnia diclina VS20]|eukprot:XP_008618462.1 hypothetical protein SDRG_14133 [Saprolegnia diclina VS20]
MLRQVRRLKLRPPPQSRPTSALATDDRKWQQALETYSEQQWRSVLADEHLAPALHKPGVTSYVHLANKHPGLLEPLLSAVVSGVHAQHPHSMADQEAYLVTVLQTMASYSGEPKLTRATSFVMAALAPTKPAQATLLFRASYRAATHKSGPAGAFHYLLTALTKHQHMDEAYQLLTFASNERIKPRADHISVVLHCLGRADEAKGAALVPSFLRLTLELLSRLKLETSPRFWLQSITSATSTDNTSLALQVYDAMRSKRIKPRPDAAHVLLEYLHPRNGAVDAATSFVRIYKDVVDARATSPAIFLVALDAAATMQDAALVRTILADVDAAEMPMGHGLLNAALRALAITTDDGTHADVATELEGRLIAAGFKPTHATLSAIVRLHRHSLNDLYTTLTALAPAFSVPTHQNVTDPASHVAYLGLVHWIRYENGGRAASDALETLLKSPHWHFDAFMRDRLVHTFVLAHQFELAAHYMLAHTDAPLHRDVYASWFSTAFAANAPLHAAVDVFKAWQATGSVTLEDFGDVIYYLCQRQDLTSALDVFELLHEPPTEKICVALMKALHAEQSSACIDSSFKDFFRLAVARGDAKAPAFHSALNLAVTSADEAFVREILETTVLSYTVDDTPTWRLDQAAYNKALYACAAHPNLHALGLRVFDHMHQHRVDINELTMMACAKMAKSFPASSATLKLLADFKELNQWPTIEVYTVILGILAQHRQWVDCDVLFSMLQEQDVALDLKATTLFGCVLAQQCRTDELLTLIAQMEQRGIEPDALFLREILARLYKHYDVDKCLDFCKHVLSVARCQVYYHSMIELALRHGLLDRALNLVIQMECDGFTIHAHVLLDIIHRVTTMQELEKLISVFAQLNDGDVDRDVPFEASVFDALLEKCDAMQIKSSVALRFIERHATALGYTVRA